MHWGGVRHNTGEGAQRWLGVAEWGIQMCMVHTSSPASSGWAGHMHGFNKICTEARAQGSRLGVGESSGELMGVVHC